MRYVLALDQGTTSSRALLVDERGRIRTVAQREFRQRYPQPGWVEHDPRDLWRTQLACVRAVLRQAGLTARSVAAIGIANQRETTLLWDRVTGEPVSNAIVWQDRRTAAHCEALRRAGHTPAVRRATGLVLDPYFSATKLAWLLDRVPGARRRAARGELAFGTVDTWLVWQLTRGALHVTDATNASRTLLYDLRRRAWSEPLLELFDIPPQVLPDVVSSSGVCGVSDPRVLGAPVPIAGLACDQQAALYGQGAHARGMAKNTYGTGCFLLLNTGAQPIASRHGLITTVAAGARDYALEGSVFVGGAVVQWLRDGLRLIRKSVDVEQLARSVPDAGGVHFVPAFTGLGAPYWDAGARGVVTGLTRGTNAGHVARAALESIAFQSAEVLDAMQKDAGVALRELRVDGGAAANDLLMQFQADLLGVPVVRPKILETTSLGAAYLAGLGVGLWRDERAVAALWQAGRRFLPRMKRREAAERMTQWREAVGRARSR